MDNLRGSLIAGIVSGIAGTLAKNLIKGVYPRDKAGDAIREKLFHFKRAGIEVKVRSQKGITLHRQKKHSSRFINAIVDYGMGILGGIGTLRYIAGNQKGRRFLKGIVAGTTMGSFTDRVRRNISGRQAAPGRTDIANLVSNTVYGIITTAVASRLSPLLGGTSALDDYLTETKKEVERECPQKRRAGNRRIRRVV